MKHPPYHLRPNKAVDRMLLIELLKILADRRPLGVYDIDEYKYWGMGGPFMDDFRLVHSEFPLIRLVSIERSQDTHKRQRFHLPSSKVELIRNDFASHLAQFESAGKEIIWLDYTDLSLARISEFQQLISLLVEGSIVKITLRSELPDEFGAMISRPGTEEGIAAEDEFKRAFGKFLPGDFNTSMCRRTQFPVLLQKILQIAAQDVLPATDPNAIVFQILESNYYNDGTVMLSLTGTVCIRSSVDLLQATLSDNPQFNLDWHNPVQIDVPMLSMKERLKLDRHLPTRDPKKLARCLGYNIDEGPKKSLVKLSQYISFYRYYPLFGKIAI